MTAPEPTADAARDKMLAEVAALPGLRVQVAGQAERVAQGRGDQKIGGCNRSETHAFSHDVTAPSRRPPTAAAKRSRPARRSRSTP